MEDVMEPQKKLNPDYKIIDSHAHLDMDGFSEDLSEVIVRAKQSGVCSMLQIIMGPEKEKINKSLDLTKKHPDFMFPTLGIHPHDAKHFSEETLVMFENFFTAHTIYAVGEIGLDYYYENSEKKQQLHCFDQLSQFALKYNKPICIHTRSAFEDTYAVCNNNKNFEKAGGVIHCFSETKNEAKKFLDLGAYISFSGIVTFKKSLAIQEAVKYVPLDRILIETDSPYLAPVPHRGKRNEPAYVNHTLEFISALKGVSKDVVAKASFKNTQDLFNLPL